MPDQRSRFGSRSEVIVNGTVLLFDVASVLFVVTVDLHLHLSDMVVLQFQDTQCDVLDRVGIWFGSRLVVSAISDGDGSLTVLFTGEVTGLEQESNIIGTRTLVRGYDLSHWLSRGRRTCMFVDITDVDIVRQFVGDVGLDLGRVDSDGSSYEYVSQVNLIDWEFLRSRVQEIGHELFVVDGKLEWWILGDHSDVPSGNVDLAAFAVPFQLLLGGTLLRFRLRVTVAEQVGEVYVCGWDLVNKQVVVGMAQASTSSASVGVTFGDLAFTFLVVPFVMVDRSVCGQQEADTVVAVVVEQIVGAHVEAEGSALGDPRLVFGLAVQVGCVGWPYDGGYVLIVTWHHYDDTGYRTDFTVSGRQEWSLLGLASLGATKGSYRAGGPLVHGMVIGQVTDVNDLDQQFRVKVSFLWLFDDYEFWWAWVIQLGVGDQCGLVWLLEVGDEVLVAFGYGDVRVLYVLGGFFNGVDVLSLVDELVDLGIGQVVKRALVSRTNYRLVLFDDDSLFQVLLSTGDDNLTITLDKTQTSIMIDSFGSVMISGSNEVKIFSDGDVSVEAFGELKLSGQMGVSIDGGPSVSVFGDLIKLN